MERFAKVLLLGSDPGEISAVEPTMYRERFVERLSQRMPPPPEQEAPQPAAEPEPEADLGQRQSARQPLGASRPASPTQRRSARQTGGAE